MLKKIKAVILDMDGVLVDSELFSKNCFEKTCNSLNIGYNEKFYLSTVGRTYDECNRMITEYLGGADNFKIFQDRYNELHNGAYEKGLIKLKKGCRELLSFLQDRNIPYALATSSPYRIVEASFLNQGYIKVPFKYVITGEEVINGKPDPEIFIKCAKLMNQYIEECMIVEDSINGVRAAYESKALTVFVPDIISPTEEVIKKSDYQLNDLFEVKSLINNIFEK